MIPLYLSAAEAGAVVLPGGDGAAGCIDILLAPARRAGGRSSTAS